MATLRTIAIGLIRMAEPDAKVAAATRALGRSVEPLLHLVDHGTVTPVTAASILNRP